MGRVHRAGPAGFSLIELLIVLAVLALFTGATLATLHRAPPRAARFMALPARSRPGAYGGLARIEREVRMAGAGWGRIDVDGVEHGRAVVHHAVEAGPDTSAAGSDSLSILGGWDANTTLRLSMFTPHTPLEVQSAAGFAVGDLCVVTDGPRAHLFQITALATNPARLEADASSPLNSAGALANWPNGGYGVGTHVYRATWLTYRLDRETFGRPALVRCVRGGTPELLVRDVTRFEVRYRLKDGSVTRRPSRPELIQDIEPSVRTSEVVAGTGPTPDSAWVSIRPAAF